MSYLGEAKRIDHYKQLHYVWNIFEYSCLCHQIAINENRIILTTGLPYEQVQYFRLILTRVLFCCEVTIIFKFVFRYPP